MSTRFVAANLSMCHHHASGTSYRHYHHSRSTHFILQRPRTHYGGGVNISDALAMRSTGGFV